MSKVDVSGIRRFARERGLKIVSAGFSLPWCDICIPAGPFEFLGLMDKADYVVTDTFHGTVFASIYHKRYASFGRTNPKVIEFMRGYGLEDHMVVVERDLEACLECRDDFKRFDTHWGEMKDVSLGFLRHAVEICSSDDSDGGETDDNIRVERGIELAPLTTFKIGGRAARLWEPKCNDDLCALPKGSEGYRVISGGSNLLVAERTFTDVISMRNYDNTIDNLGDGRYRVGASVRVQKLISCINANGYGGIEALVSVPGMVGGLVNMNASVPSAKTCISDYLLSVKAFDGKRIVEIPKSECNFGHRKSRFQDGKMLILSVLFEFPAQDSVVSAGRIEARRKYVRKVQDNSAPNFGSVFSSASKKAMELIREKGLKVGGISFSRKTSNWMLNEGGSFGDALCLLRKAAVVNKLFGKKAKPEVRIWR